MSTSRSQVDSQLTRLERRARGVYYTPPAAAAFIVGAAWDAWIAGCDDPARAPRVLEPSCGGGAFLAACRRHPQLSRAPLWGIDPDAAAVAAARETLAAESTPDMLAQAEILCGDALDDPRLPPNAFDLIVGNPPYVNVRQLPKAHSAERLAAWRERFQTARGNFDLYVLFFERALSLLRSGGVLAFIVPNKVAVLDYARACRALLLEHTIVEAADLSMLKIFPEAGVYPYVFVVRKTPPPPGHHVRVRTLTTPAQLHHPPAPRLMPQAAWSAARFSFAEELNVEARVPTRPFGDCARLHSGASGYTASALSGRLREHVAADDENDAAREFLVSGNIDPYTIRTGDVRFLGTRYVRPMLDITRADVSAGKRLLYAAPKIVIAGLASRLEAAWDDRGAALGVQVFAAMELQHDPFFLLGLLNSRLMTALFRTRFAAKKLAGNYFAVNKGQLAQLPLAIPDSADRTAQRRVRQIAQLAERLHRTGRDPAMEAEVDRLVTGLYCVTAAELRSLEAESPSLQRRAA